MKLMLFIKGTRSEAEAELARRKIDVIDVIGVIDVIRDNEVWALVDPAARDKVIQWFCGDAQAPYPAGTLLYYSEGA